MQDQQNQEQKEYRDFIKQSAFEGTYFKDALDWYLFRYVRPLTDRTIMIFVSVVGAISLFCLIQIISGLFPLVEKIPITVASKDQSIYAQFIHPLKNAKEKNVSVDDAIARYLVAVYVSDRESYDYRKSEVEDVNRKFNRIKNMSSSAEYRNFQLFMDRGNADSPLNFFGASKFRNIEVQSVNFVENASQKNYYSRFKDMFLAHIPNEAEIKFVAIDHDFDDRGTEKTTRTNYVAKVKFAFAGADRNAKKGIMNFAVNNYKLYKVK